MQLRSIALTSLVACFATLSAQAQAQMDGTLLPLGTDTFNVSYAGRVTGRAIQTRAVSGNQLVQVYRWRSAQSDSALDSLISDRRTLRSIREVRVVRDTVIEVLYDGDTIVVTKRTRGSAAQRFVTVSAPGAFSSAILDGVAAAAPLAVGYQQELHFYFAPPAQLGVVPIRLRVESSDPILDRNGRTLAAWRVTANTSSGVITFWIDKATRSVLKMDSREGAALTEFRR